MKEGNSIFADDWDAKQPWQNTEHLGFYSQSINARSELSFMAHFSRMISARSLNYVLNAQNIPDTSLLDVGCAAGNYYRYLSHLRMPGGLAYAGVDASKPAIDAAQRRYGSGLFELIRGDEDLVERSADVVLSADVVQHQLRPFDHLRQLLSCARRYLVVALRTRDVGGTVLDAELSRQKVYGQWVPFIVLNIDEVYRTILSHQEAPLRVTAFKNHQVLGVSTRSLPEELSTEAAGGAVTNLIVEKNIDAEESQIDEFDYDLGAPMSKSTSRILGAIGLGANKFGLGGMAAWQFRQKIGNLEAILNNSKVIGKHSLDLTDLNN
jgi:SAM-dependent methyltransferase